MFSQDHSNLIFIFATTRETKFLDGGHIARKFKPRPRRAIFQANLPKVGVCANLLKQQEMPVSRHVRNVLYTQILNFPQKDFNCQATFIESPALRLESRRNVWAKYSASVLPLCPSNLKCR